MFWRIEAGDTVRKNRRFVVAKSSKEGFKRGVHMNEDKKKKCETEWTIMIYFAADNDLEEAACKVLKQIKKAGSSKDLNIIAQLDTRGTGRMFRFRLRNENTTLEEDVLDVKKEINTADPTELKNFIEWAKENFPAERFMLIIWGHGQGWQMANDTHTPNRVAARTTDKFYYSDADISASIADAGELRVFSQNPTADKVMDELVKNIWNFRPSTRSWFDSVREIFERKESGSEKKWHDDVLTCKGLSEALKGHKLDILGMDACMMGMAEVGCEINKNVDVGYLVASEDAVPVESWPYDTILARLRKKPSMSADKLAVTIVREYLLRYKDEPKGVTISSCNLKFSEYLIRSVSYLVDTLLRKMVEPEVHLATMIARAEVQSFYLRDFVDLFDYCERLSQVISHEHEDIKAECKKVMKALHDDVNKPLSAETFVRAYGFVSSPMKGARGASVYFPCRNLEGYGYYGYEHHGSEESEESEGAREIEIYKKLEFVERTNWYGFLEAFTKPVRLLDGEAKTGAEIRPDRSVRDKDDSRMACFSGFGHIKSECGTPLKMPLPHSIEIPDENENDPCNEKDQE